MEANYHQVVANMKPEVFEIYNNIRIRLQGLTTKHIDETLGEDDPVENEIYLAIDEQLQGIMREIETDPNNWIPVPKQGDNCTVTSTGGALWIQK